MTSAGRAPACIVLVAALGCGGERGREREAARPERPADDTRRRFWDVYERAGRSRVAGRCEEAIALYDQALAVRSEHEDALYYRASCAVDLGRYDEAAAGYERLVAVNPKGSSRGHMQLGLLYASPDDGAPRDLARAERHLREALSVDPDSGAVLALGELALLRGDRAAARTLLRDASSGDPMSLAAPYLLGFLDWEAGRRDAAWEAFRLAVSRGELKKPAVSWTEEGDVKADPGLRWRALSRQSLTGRHWMRLRAYLAPPGPTPADMDAEYALLRVGLRRR